MKRVLIAIIIIGLIISLGLYEKARVFDMCEKLESDIEDCVALYKTDNKKCAARCEELKTRWTGELNRATLFINHEFTDELSGALAVMPVYANEKNDSDFYAAGERIKQLLNSLKHDQKITADSFY